MTTVEDLLRVASILSNISRDAEKECSRLRKVVSARERLIMDLRTELEGLREEALDLRTQIVTARAGPASPDPMLQPGSPMDVLPRRPGPLSYGRGTARPQDK
jgi:hypothetical protein